MNQDQILPPGAASGMASYYGFDSSFWPVDANGVLHFLGDGSPNSPHMLEVLRDADTLPGDVQWNQRFSQSIAWYEVMHYRLSGRTGYAIREISREDALAFDPSADGFDGTNLVGSGGIGLPNDRLQEPGWEFVGLLGETPTEAERHLIRYAGMPFNVASRTWSPLVRTPHTSQGNHYNPYQGNRYLQFEGVSGGETVWRETAEFQRLISYQDGEEVRWVQFTVFGFSHSGSANRRVVHPDDYSTDPADYVIQQPTGLPNPGDILSDHTVIVPFRGARFAQLRVTTTELDPLAGHTGSLGSLLNLTSQQVNLQVDKVYEDGSTDIEGVIPGVEARMSTPVLGGFVSRQHFSESMNDERYHSQFGTLIEHSDPYFTIYAQHDVAPLITEQYLATYVRRVASHLTTGVGFINERHLEGGASNPPQFVAPILEDVLLLRIPGPVDIERDLTEFEDANCPTPSPGAGWIEAEWGWYRKASTDLRFTALLSDDADAHDPRANTANATTLEFLQLGSGLMYEGELGQLPRPHSGVTGVFCGREITGDGAFAVDVLKRPQGDLMVVLLQDEQLQAWAHNPSVPESAEALWDRPLAESMPADWLADLSPAEPVVDFRFLARDWPTPTGVLTFGGRSFVLAVRDAGHRGFSFDVVLEDDTVETVSPPFLAYPAWDAADLFFTAEMRCSVGSDDDNGGGGVS